MLAILLFAMYVFDINFNLNTVLKFMGFTAFFAIIPLTIRVISVNNSLLKDKLAEARKLSEVLVEKKSNYEKEIIELKSNLVQEVAKTNSRDLLFIVAEKNYITIVDIKENRVRRRLLRLALVRALDQIQNGNIIRCHRSYVVNIGAVSRVVGNSQGLKLVLKEELDPIPVSKTYKKEVEKKIASLSEE